MLAVLALVAYKWALQVYGPGSHSRTIALLALIGGQLGHTFNCRSRTRSAFQGLLKSPFILVSAVVVIVLQLLAVWLSPLARVLGTVPPSQTDWIVIGLCSVAPILIVETTKAISRWQAAGDDRRTLAINRGAEQP
jgi:magnesium-transporting ATPase (P-type)